MAFASFVSKQITCTLLLNYTITFVLTFSGCVLGGILADSCGRKLATMLVIAADAIGWWFIIADFHVPILLAGRSLCGVFSGAVGVLAPMYVVETVSRCRRGRTASASAVISGAGMLLAGGCTLLTLSWRWLAIVALGLNLVFISAVCLLLPESPRWLVKKGKSAEAKESLIWLKMGDQAAVDSELDAITTSFTESQEQQQQQRVSLRRLFTHKRYRIPLMLALLLALGRPMSGQPAIMSFLWQICNKAGLSNAPIISVTVSLLIIITTTAKSFAIDRLSRRVFLGVGGGLLTVSLLLMAFTDISQRQGWATNTAITSIVSLIGILGYFVAFTISWAVLSFLILNEVLPTAIRSFGGGGASAIQQLVNFAVTQVFQQTEKTIQLGYTFIVFAVLNSITTFTVVQLLPDTRNKSLEDIEQHFQRK